MARPKSDELQKVAQVSIAPIVPATLVAKTIHTLDLMQGVRFGIIPNITRVSTKAVVDAPSQLKVKSIVEEGDRIIITTINDAETIIFPANQKSAERA